KHQIISANITGHSMGGKLAMNLALKYPEKVKKLVVVDIAPKEYPRKHDFIIDSLQSLKLENFSSRKELEHELSKTIKDIKIIQFLLKNIKRDKNKDFAWKMNLNSIIKNYDNINKAIKCDYPFEGPTLFIKGGLSDYITEDDIECIKTLFPNFKLITVENAGHWVHAEQSEKFIEVLTEFI
ncbi:MAG TPA: alpha/beta fold hydrolase, partial [Bacteroidetes bacterium]|nr:alpha/beta fold hydrolase [Bacteroidota bacterium]